MLALTTHLSKLEKNKTSALEKFQGVRGKKTQTHTTTKGMDPKECYVEGLNNLEYWRVNK